MSALIVKEDGLVLLFVGETNKLWRLSSILFSVTRLLLVGSLIPLADYLLAIVEFPYIPVPPKNACFKQSAQVGRSRGSHIIIILIKSKACGVAIGITFYKLCNTRSLLA